MAYRIGVPEHCYYSEIMNSDSRDYGGSNLGNEGGVQAQAIPWHGQPCSMSVMLPPLAAVYFKPSR
jgi:1,4-alpha-glucan branching enzyme